eukprot:TRINITY_DN7010_c0_g1_i1.p1 TRINITY_DN7010_c0_g1~~TRINITY_DN7010_c0_g1_i1.p1  ORF type:complete len:100 (-),score=17.79 TRINITY_DN7010_c0_g1_i1:28-327(-)
MISSARGWQVCLTLGYVLSFSLFGCHLWRIGVSKGMVDSVAWKRRWSNTFTGVPPPPPVLPTQHPAPIASPALPSTQTNTHTYNTTLHEPSQSTTRKPT